MNKDYTIEVNETVNAFLNSLSDDELRSIINDSDQESRLDELIEKCPIVPKLKQEKEMLIAKNKSLADFNYKKEPTLNELRKVLEDAHQQAVELKQTLIEKQTKLNKLKPNMTPDTLRSLLQVAAQESEEQSEEVAKQYLNNEKTYDEFQREFIKKRTEYHIRRIKYEKLIDSIQNPNLSQNSLNNRSHNNPPTSLNQSTSSNSLHYPSNFPPSNFPPTSFPPSNPSLPYPTNAPFAYQPFNNPAVPNSAHPIRSAPLPPNMMELPPYYSSGPNAYTPQSTNQPTYPFNVNPNYR